MGNEYTSDTGTEHEYRVTFQVPGEPKPSYTVTATNARLAAEQGLALAAQDDIEHMGSYSVEPV